MNINQIERIGDGFILTISFEEPLSNNDFETLVEYISAMDVNLSERIAMRQILWLVLCKLGGEKRTIVFNEKDLEDFPFNRISQVRSLFEETPEEGKRITLTAFEGNET